MQAKIVLSNSLFHVVARYNHQLMDMCYVIIDSTMFFYIQDLIVDPDFQHGGIGSVLMQNIEAYLSKNALSGATIGLLSAKD
ncbi:GNAT family N-acetyltransferase [Thalassotalea atypica]|uniref:GNAT family N-acetyltransferase n=1 Tax=Thalassotalea atypica TaxID=2054316 RepID=UPI002573BF72|nr:GNAT family N-acetyltransferase [Thalassotalea atypica]